MDKYISIKVTPKEDDKEDVEITANGTIDEMVLMLVDIICAMSEKFGVTAKSIAEAVNDELEDWE